MLASWKYCLWVSVHDRRFVIKARLQVMKHTSANLQEHR